MLEAWISYSRTHAYGLDKRGGQNMQNAEVMCWLISKVADLDEPMAISTQFNKSGAKHFHNLESPLKCSRGKFKKAFSGQFKTV